MITTSIMQNYDCLREHFLSVASNRINEDLLTTVKDHYKSIINSQRVFDKITTVQELVWTLEKRGVLGPENINPMQHIAQFYICDRNLNEMLSTFEKENQQKDYVAITIYNHGKFKRRRSLNKFEIEEPLINSETVVVKSVENLNHTVKKKSRRKDVKQTLLRSFMYVILVTGLVIFVTLITNKTSHFYLNSSLILKKNISNLSDTEIHRGQVEYGLNLWGQNVQTSNRSSSVDQIQSLGNYNYLNLGNSS